MTRAKPTNMPNRLFKFIITDRDLVLDDAGRIFRACSAVVLAPNVYEAREHLRAYCAREGLETRWFEFVEAVEVDRETPGVVSWTS